MSNESYTIEEVAQLLKVSKLTVYDLVKKGALPSYRVGRQMRVDAIDLENYKEQGKGIKAAKIYQTDVPFQQTATIPPSPQPQSQSRSIIISGQDVSLDILASMIEANHTADFRPLRSYVGSLDSLIAMYHGNADIVSMHLLDGDSKEYNIPYVRKILVSHPFITVNLMSRTAGLYVQKGNPHNTSTWKDLVTSGVKIVNREKGSGARILLDEQLRLNGIKQSEVAGYEVEKTSHLGVAGAIANKEADIGVGIEKVAQTVGIDFIPLIQERYDLVMLKSPANTELIQTVLRTLRSEQFKSQLQSLGGYDVSLTGEIMYETDF